MSGIVWLASYPKSGNTWLRIFLTNYRRNAAEPADFNELDGGPIASARSSFDEIVGVESSELTEDEIETYRPAVYRLMANESRETLFLKVHDAYLCTRSGEPLFPPEVTEGVLYIIRHPCDVAISNADHNGSTVDAAIRVMGTKNYKISARQTPLDTQLPQRLGSWSEHVESWVDAAGLNVQVVRYEDMREQPMETFGAALNFVGMPYDTERLERAIAFSRFEIMQEQERTGNFRDRSPLSPRFFREGRAGAWHTVLNDKQVDAIIRAHGEVMRRFGYLDDSGKAN